MASKKKTPTPPLPSFVFGDQVELCGLKNSPQLNRRVGTVAGGLLENGRYPVTLFDECDQINVKPENLKGFLGQIANCNHCQKNFSDLTVCGNCHMASYCSQDCQKAHWIRHKQLCASLKQARKAKHDEAKLPSDPKLRIWARFSRGTRWMNMRKYDHAEAEYQAILQEPLFEQYPSEAKFDLYLSLACAIVNQDKRPEKEIDAIAILRKAVALPHSTPEGKKYLADAYYRLGYFLDKIQDFDGAEQAYKAGIENGDGIYTTVEELQRKLQEVKTTKKHLAKEEKKKSRKGRKGKKGRASAK